MQPGGHGSMGQKRSQIVSAAGEHGQIKTRTYLLQSALRIWIFLKLKTDWTGGWSDHASDCSSVYTTSVCLSHPHLTDLELICFFKTLRLCSSLYIKQRLVVFLCIWMHCLYSFWAVPAYFARSQSIFGHSSAVGMIASPLLEGNLCVVSCLGT